MREAGEQGGGKKHGGSRGERRTRGHGRGEGGHRGSWTPGDAGTEQRWRGERMGGRRGAAGSRQAPFLHSQRPPRKTCRRTPESARPSPSPQRAGRPRNSSCIKHKSQTDAHTGPPCPSLWPSVRPVIRPALCPRGAGGGGDGARLAGLAAEACSSLRPRSASRYSANYGGVCRVILIHVSCLESRLQPWALGQDRGREGRARNLPPR